MKNNISGIINNTTIKLRKDGRYEARTTINGIRKSFYGKSKSEVKNKLKEYLSKIENGFKEPQKIVFNDYIEYWLKKYKWNKIEPSSFSRLYKVYIFQIKDTIGKKKIGNITRSDIQGLIDMYANPSDKSVKPLARSGLKKIIHLIRPCMNIAVEEGVISENPCKDILIPKESCMTVKTKEQFSLSDDELVKLKEAALAKNKKGEYYSRDGIVLLLVINLGLRVGEVLALKWENIDLINCLVYIKATVQSNIIDFNNEHGKATYNRIKESTKTEAGDRVLKLNSEVVWYINELIAYDLRNDIVSEYVCCCVRGNMKGKMKRSEGLKKSLDRLIKKSNINKGTTLHTLRHTFGSSLIRQGIRIDVVSKLMGHANITITYNKYIHVIREEEAKAMTMVKVC